MQRIMSLLAAEIAFWLRLARMGTREQLAHRYLKQPGLSTSEIAFLLGFEDPNSFHCAFQGWTGTTPSTLRGNRKIYLFGIIQPLSMTPR